MNSFFAQIHQNDRKDVINRKNSLKNRLILTGIITKFKKIMDES